MSEALSPPAGSNCACVWHPSHETPAVWERNQKRTTVSVHSGKKLQSVVLDGGIWVDANAANNTWTVK